MFTLHIEHPITDYDAWRKAFDRFAEMRSASGVSSHTIWQPVDDPGYVLIDLNFETSDRAESFLDMLRTRVWADPGNSPGLAGVPVTRILQVRDSATTVGDHLGDEPALIGLTGAPLGRSPSGVSLGSPPPNRSGASSRARQ